LETGYRHFKLITGGFYRSNMYIALKVKLQIGTNDLDIETYTKKLENKLTN
jgi:hypothetical protein